VSNKLVWAKWFWSDWAGDAALNLCSLPARGLWMALLCLAAQGEPYGTVTIKGRAVSDEELFRLLAPKGTRPRQFYGWLAELERHGVATREPNGSLSSARQKKDGMLHNARASAARKSWGKAENGNGLHMQKPDIETDLHMQSGTGAQPFASHRAEAEAQAKSPRSPPRGARTRGPSRNPFVDLLAEQLDAEATDSHREGAPVVQFPRGSHRHKRIAP
jgi:hypothetical protein